MDTKTPRRYRRRRKGIAKQGVSVSDVNAAEGETISVKTEDAVPDSKHEAETGNSETVEDLSPRRSKRLQAGSELATPEPAVEHVDEVIAAAQITPIKRSKRLATKKHSPYFAPTSSADTSAPKKRSRRRSKAETAEDNRSLEESEKAASAVIAERQPISEDRFGLLQEVYAPDAFRVIIVAMFCNQTPGTRARPFLEKLFIKYPDAEALSKADQEVLAEEIKPLGLHNVRARRLIQLAEAWLAGPPVTGQCSPRKGLAKKLGYPDTEISHLPGCGPYAMDSYRLFCTGEGWRSVRPEDKELVPYTRWRWSKEGVDYDQLLREDVTAR